MSVRKLGAGELLGDVVRSASAPGIRCLEVCYQAGLQLATHAHDSPFFALSMDGTYAECARGRSFQCVPRTVLFHAAGEEHAVSIGPGGVRCFVMELDALEMERRYAGSMPESFICVDGGHLATLLASAYEEFRTSDSCSALAIQGVALQLMAAGSRRTEAGVGRPSWMARLENLLRERFQAPLTLEEIAAEVGVSPAHVSAEFRRIYRCSIAEELRRLRVEYACLRLRDGTASLADVANGAGFCDQPHFSRTFKQITGMTPGRYRTIFGTPEIPLS